MHRPPAVSFPVGRSRWHATVLAACMSLALLSLFPLAWAADTEFPAWAVWGQVLLVLLAGIGAAVAWHRSPVGTLRWDGEHWLWVASQDHAVSGLRIVFDFQRLVLVSLQRAGQPLLWLWLEPVHDTPHNWLALRRALVHSTQHGLRAPSQSTDQEGLLP